MNTWRAIFVLLAATIAARLPAQSAPGQGFSQFISAKLLREAHASAPNQNVVISPLPVSLAFAPLRGAVVMSAQIEEMTSAFEWSNGSNLPGSGRILTTIFQKPIPAPRRPQPHVDKLMQQLMNHESPEELWISTVFTYRGSDSLSQSFVDMSTKYFGVNFQSIAWDAKPPIPRSPQDTTATAEPAEKKRDFWISSTTHLRTAWADNTFSLGKKVDADFFPNAGPSESAPTLITELNMYAHDKNSDFEEVVFECHEAYMQVVLPREGLSIAKLEEKLSTEPNSLATVPHRELGYVELPKFNFEFGANLRQALENMGVREVFRTNLPLLEMAPNVSGAVLEAVSQKTTFEFNEEGIRADAETVANGVYGGVMGGQPNPFHMIVNRPFLFFVRDNLTNSLLFAGAVMDPAKH